jgi:hypothetical protein
MGDKKRTSKLFDAHPGKLLLDERVSRILLPVLDENSNILEEDSEDPLLDSEEEIDESVPEEPTTLKLFLGVPSLSEIDEKEDVIDNEEGHVWDLSSQDFEDFDIFDEDSVEDSVEEQTSAIIGLENPIKVFDLGAVDEATETELGIEVEAVEPIVGGSLREFIDKPIKEFVDDEVEQQESSVSIQTSTTQNSVIQIAKTELNEDFEIIDDDWDEWENEEWNDFTLSGLLAEPPPEDASTPVNSYDETVDLSVNQTDSEEEQSDEKGAQLAYFSTVALLEPQDDEEDIEPTMVVVDTEEELEDDSEEETSEDPLFPDDPTHESTMLVDVDYDDYTEKLIDPDDDIESDNYLQIEETPRYKQPYFFFIVLVAIATITILLSL